MKNVKDKYSTNEKQCRVFILISAFFIYRVKATKDSSGQDREGRTG